MQDVQVEQAKPKLSDEQAALGNVKQYLLTLATHAIWTVWKAGETVYQADKLPTRVQNSRILSTL